MKTAYMFPGQGSQFPGMGRDLYESNGKARQLFDKADEILGFKITDVMFNGTAEDLLATAVTQPAVFLHSYISFACLAQARPDMTAGHSLGEFSALCAAGALDFEDALKLVSIRANAMQKCCADVPGGMAAILALPDETVEAICAEVAGEGLGTLVAANYNCNGQIVISGTVAAIEQACIKMKEAGAKRALPLKVSGAFHSPLMEPAREELAEAIESTVFKVPECPVYQNVSACAETDPTVIKANLLKQLTSPVRWTQSVRNMLADGAVSFTEFGPGNVLQGLVKKIAAGMEGISVQGAVTVESK